MVVRDRVVNQPSDPAGERRVRSTSSFYLEGTGGNRILSRRRPLREEPTSCQLNPSCPRSPGH